MLELLQSIGNAITSFISQITTFFSYVGRFFSLIGDVFTYANQLLTSMVPTWVGIFAVATLFVSILWIIIEII